MMLPFSASFPSRDQQPFHEERCDAQDEQDRPERDLPPGAPLLRVALDLRVRRPPEPGGQLLGPEPARVRLARVERDREREPRLDALRAARRYLDLPEPGVARREARPTPLVLQPGPLELGPAALPPVRPDEGGELVAFPEPDGMRLADLAGRLAPVVEAARQPPGKTLEGGQEARADGPVGPVAVRARGEEQHPPLAAPRLEERRRAVVEAHEDARRRPAPGRLREHVAERADSEEPLPRLAAEHRERRVAEVRLAEAGRPPLRRGLHDVQRRRQEPTQLLRVLLRLDLIAERDEQAAALLDEPRELRRLRAGGAHVQEEHDVVLREVLARERLRVDERGPDRRGGRGERRLDEVGLVAVADRGGRAIDHEGAD